MTEQVPAGYEAYEVSGYQTKHGIGHVEGDDRLSTAVGFILYVKGGGVIEFAMPTDRAEQFALSILNSVRAAREEYPE